MPSRSIHAFWSYSRRVEHHGGEALHAAMCAAMDEAMAPSRLCIYRDADRKFGIGSGEDWPKALVRAIGGSAMFFWVQSPRWLNQPVCRFEFDAFSDRLMRAATRIAPADAESIFGALWAASVVPIRWVEARDSDHWSEIPEPARSSLRSHWNNMNVLPALQLSDPRPGLSAAHDGYAGTCKSAASSILDQLSDKLKGLGLTRSGWAEVLASDVRDFERDWNDEFERRFPGGPPGQDEPAREATGGSLVDLQMGLARRFTSGRTRIERADLDLVLTLLPDADGSGRGVWCTSAPISNSAAACWSNRFGELFSARPGSSGVLMWTAAEVMRLRAELAAEGLQVPDAARGERLGRMLNGDRDSLLRLGLQALPRDFWTLDPGLGPRTRSGDATRAPLLLVSPISRPGHG